jgi:hypothetical protein
MLHSDKKGLMMVMSVERGLKIKNIVVSHLGHLGLLSFI